MFGRVTPEKKKDLVSALQRPASNGWPASSSAICLFLSHRRHFRIAGVAVPVPPTPLSFTDAPTIGIPAFSLALVPTPGATKRVSCAVPSGFRCCPDVNLAGHVPRDRPVQEPVSQDFFMLS